MRAEKLSLNLPFGLGGVEFVPNVAERRAAWSIYVELTTRIAVQPFDPENGSLREVLSSLHTLFGLTRQILREAGPDVAHSPESFGPLAIKILTEGLAPFLTKWHQRLLKHELSRPDNVSPLEHERAWEHFPQMARELTALQEEMKGYTEALAVIAGAE